MSYRQMEVRLALKAAGFIGLNVVGMPGNLAVLLLFCHFFLAHGHLPHNKLILSQLVFANLMMTVYPGHSSGSDCPGYRPVLR
ncbi:hypothetical protein SKAU_G00169170 [Synaphobranchus kaupii]|uniref:Vomeronasal type-1 receptor n=1 Tax=Synaphobranchus kaupii TaxID=118154 RepID=A0A9Q1J0N5_SYNKA|nr:hypothetical protein SKAU_G00169170 [Synaphobranchus kaupii]